MSEKDFTPKIIYQELQKLDSKKSTGVDGIHRKILFECVDFFSKILSIIYSHSYKSSHVPGKWKEANLRPIFKNGQRISRKNYRPISLTAIPGKLWRNWFEIK